MTTPPHQPPRRAPAFLWALCVLLTAGTGIVVGYLAVWFQLFGETADADDHRVAAAAYGTAAVVLLLAVPAVLAQVDAARWPAWLAAAAAGVLGLLAADSVASIDDAEPGPGINTALDGIGGVLWAPWTWVLVVLGLRGLWVLGRRAFRAGPRRSRPAPPGTTAGRTSSR